MKMLCGFVHLINRLWDTIRKTIATRKNDADRVRKAAREVYNSKVVSSQIATALQTGNLNADLQPNEKALLREVYVYDEGNKIVSILKKADEKHQTILGDINRVSMASSPLKKWFFSGKQTKEMANNAFLRLKQLIQGDYPVIIKDLEDASTIISYSGKYENNNILL